MWLKTNQRSKDTLPPPHVLPLTIPSMPFSYKARLQYQEIPLSPDAGYDTAKVIVGRILYCICEFKRIFMGWVRGESGGRKEGKKSIEALEDRK